MGYFPSGNAPTLVSFDTNNAVHTFSGTDGTVQSWIADQDCFVVGTVYYTENALSANDAYVTINGLKIGSIQMQGVGSSPSKDYPLGVYCPVKKGQTVAVRSKGYNYIKCYGLKI